LKTLSLSRTFFALFFVAAQDRIARKNPSLNAIEVEALWLAQKKEKKLKRKLAREGRVAASERLLEVSEPESKRRRRQENREASPNGHHAQAEMESPDCEGDEEEGEENHYGLQRGSHGYGIQPLGNLLLSASGCNVRDVGLGTLQTLSDETVFDILSNLDGRDLARLALVSKAFYVFAHQDSLWRSLALEDYKGVLGFQGCWKTTYLASHVPNYAGPPHLPLKVHKSFQALKLSMHFFRCCKSYVPCLRFCPGEGFLFGLPFPELAMC
jgi:hypothetical protein